MTRISLLTGAVLLAAAGGVAVAQGPGQRPDPNADVTRDQVIQRTSEMFGRLDANRDGRFTPDEARAMGEQRRAERRTRMFDRLDGNHDGNISRDEFAAAHAGRAGGEGRGPMMRHRRMMRMGPPPGGPDGPGGPGMGPPPGGPEGGPGMRGARLFGEQGFVTLEQMRERALARFDRADANHDGTLTADERRAARQQMREGFRERRRPN